MRQPGNYPNLTFPKKAQYFLWFVWMISAKSLNKKNLAGASTNSILQNSLVFSLYMVSSSNCFFSEDIKTGYKGLKFCKGKYEKKKQANGLSSLGFGTILSKTKCSEIPQIFPLKIKRWLLSSGQLQSETASLMPWALLALTALPPHKGLFLLKFFFDIRMTWSKTDWASHPTIPPRPAVLDQFSS